MLTVLVILAIWVLLSLPLSVLLGVSLRHDDRRGLVGHGVRELVGMDGDAAVYRCANGALERVSLIDRTAV